MARRLYVVTALLLVVLLAASCKEESAGTKLDPKVVAATVEEAGKAADALDAMTKRAYSLSQVGYAMAAQGIEGAGKVLDDALATAKDVRSQANKARLAELRAATENWPAAEKEQVLPALDRMDKATTRVWVTRSAAEGVALLDKGRAKALLMEAAAESEAIPDKKYRDLDLRGVAAALSQMDTQAALAVAGRIADPRVKSAALTEIAAGAGADASRILVAAADTALAITQMEPESELVTADTPAEIKAKVLAAQRSKLAASAARAMSAAAVGMNAVDPQASKGMFAKAEELASGIEHPYTKAYAMSDVAIAMAGVDPQGAEELAGKIDTAHSDAVYAALMKVAEVRGAKAGKADEDGLGKAMNAAKNIAEPYDRAKALTAVALAMAGSNRDKATEMASEIDYAALRNEVLAAAAVAANKESADLMKQAMDKIKEPRFAKAEVLYTKGKAYCEMAEQQAATDKGAALKLYGKAAGNAADAKSAKLQWRAAAGMCRLDQDKLFDVAAKIEGDDSDKAMSLSDIASDWSAKGDGRSGMVWDMAAKAASSVDDSGKSSELLAAVATRCARYDKARASAIFGKAVEKANKIGAAKG